MTGMAAALQFLLECALKVSAIILIALVALPLLRKKSAAIRHSVLIAAISSGIVIPVMALTLPSWNPAVFEHYFSRANRQGAALQPSATLAEDNTEQVGHNSTSHIPVQLPFGIWLAGMIAGFFALGTGARRLAQITKLSEPSQSVLWTQLLEAVRHDYGIRNCPVMLQTRNTSILVTWGLRQPTILLPAGAPEWPADRIEAVLRHELAHIRRADWLTQTLAETVRIVYWFNPLLWLCCHRLRLESEHSCDDAVIRNGMSGTQYATHLLDLVRLLNTSDGEWSAALSIARPSTIERRFAAMLDTSVNRTPISRRSIQLVVLAALCLAIPLAALSSSSAPASLSASEATVQGAISVPSGPELSGTAFDQRHLPIPGVEVQAVNTDSRTKAGRVISDAQGRYSFSEIPTGVYRITFALPGFKTLNVDNVSLNPGQSMAMDEMLAVSATAEELTLTPASAGTTTQPAPAPSGRGQRGAGPNTTPINVIPGVTGGSVRAANLLVLVKPEYPAAAQAGNIQGVVVIEGIIAVDGTLTSLRAVSGQPVLSQAALTALANWRYAPTLLDGLPITVPTTITVNFTLP